MVSDQCNDQHPEWKLRKSTILFYKKAAEYFSVFDNNATFAEVYFGNISIFNIKKYDELMDASYVPLMFKYKE